MDQSQYGRFRPKRTMYRGMWFRSNLEARTAEAFDALGVPWEYEPICLRGRAYSHGQYTPDFWLPRAHAYVEVVGKIDNKHLSNALTACRDLNVKNPNASFDEIVPADERPCFYIMDGNGDLHVPEDVDANLFFCDCPCDLPVVHSVGSFACPYCGTYDGDHHLDGNANLFTRAKHRA